MEYRSDVTIRVHGERDVLEAFIVQMKLQWCKEEPFEEDAIRWDDISFIAEFEDYKWYEDFPFVVSWTKAFESLNGREDIYAEFIRLGEEENDNYYANYGVGDNDRSLWMSRSIVND